MYKRLAAFFAVLCIALSFCGRSDAALMENKTERLCVTVMTKYDEVNPEQNLELLIKFKLAEGWHIFANNPGAIGLPTVVELANPNSFQVEKTEWSTPETFEVEGLELRGYSGYAFYKAILKPQTGLKNYPLEMNLSWQACQDECIPEKMQFKLNLPATQKLMLPVSAWEKQNAEAEESFSENNADMTSVSESIASPSVQQEISHNLIIILLMAFVGGLILNFMPCIFPILTIKAINLAQGTYSPRKNRIEAMIYFAGVFVSFMIIASVLYVLREAGEEIGWGFQLQSPVFVSIMIVVFFIIFLMFLDVINIRNPFANRVGRISFKRQKINAFMTGFFAVLIASPCTAPFMGIAIGYTLSAPLYVYYPVFAALSVGYALPFALAGMFPKAVHKVLPRPGRWMDILKKIFAIPVFLTVVWLVWVLHSQTASKPIFFEEKAIWQPYDVAEVEKSVAKGESVFIDFTAKWCITCLMNEKLALQTETFHRLASEKNIRLFKADWTNQDENISKALGSYGRNSIPLYVYYDGRSGSYEILPQLITPGILEDYLKD